MANSKASLKLGDSWVVEGENSGPEDQTKDSDPDFIEEAPPPKQGSKPTRRRAAKASPTPEPQLKMPTLDSNSLDGSWVDQSRPSRSSRAPRLAEKPREVRRRSTRQSESSSPESPVERKPSKPIQGHHPTHDMLEVIMDHAGAMLSWSFDVLGRALRILKTPISYALAIWLLFGLGIVVRNLITTSIYASLSPICRIPGTSLLNLPFCPGGGDNDHVPNIEFDQLMTVQNKFEEVLEESAGGVSLPMDMKRGEASIRDLRQLVKYSHIHSKNELLLEFDGFIDTARIASYDLQKFNSHIGRAVDSVLATTRWTSRILTSIEARDASRSSLTNYILAPFQPVHFTESALLDQYIRHTALIEDELLKLITEAQALLMVLSNLEDRLEIIHGISTRDGVHANSQKEAVLGELWTMLGGNKHKLSKVDKSLFLLRQVGVYRKNAYAHVSGTIVKLQAIGAGIEDLRERVGSVGVTAAAVPLEVHIENIQRGVERLEEGRNEARRKENEYVRQTLERGQMSEGSLIEN
jgi:hypothetical protein